MNTSISNDSLNIAKSKLLEPWNITENIISNAINSMMTKNVDYADMYFQHSSQESWSLEEGIVKNGNFSISNGVGIRALSGERTAFAYSDSLSYDDIINSAKTVRTITNSGTNGSRIYVKPSKIQEVNNLYSNYSPMDSMETGQKIFLLEKIERIARKLSPNVSQVMASLSSERDIVVIAGSDGRFISDVRPLVRVSITVIAESKGRREIGRSGGGARTDLLYFSDEILTSYVKQAVNEALINLEATSAPAGEMTVVLGNGWPGILLHEAVGHGLEGDFNRKGSSIFSGRLGDKVASKDVTVIDDGTIPNRRGSLNIDDEGNITKKNILIENGVLKGYMHDIMNSNLMGVLPTGNGRRESFAHIPLPRMTNTYMLGGMSDPKEIISSVKKGLYAVNFAGGQVDITSGKFVFSASEAYIIENGKIINPVKGATIIGNGPDVMQQISMIGNDLALDSGVGVCGKDGQSIPVGVGMPTVRIEKLTVGGTG
ncbi:TldD protein [Candidatus Kinetoplastibacterium blastocrithidii TCC012E]|uniref:TldD protein n=1 Tax=Candidatus Kinetoplastidibacterium blastocrithidiae TCC012E TaxID=1208922 RepID=M1LW87_9PROT|nr:metalloprotease TldD [Candidatus Kinetoplastibacterium blastocrithidii]AFZ83670.1 TldD protein [Candidatus Kinetoplastibacterium blastocrithidii (ex Strigomonas culicis)]AGF49792.1 TldD protein [Candidatus Kinetoplastibacterium blastocrithidii TCC012E]